MNNSGLVIDASEVLEMFHDFDERQRKKVYQTATRKALGIVKKQALSNLKSSLGAGAMSRVDRYGNSLRKGFKMRLNRDGKGGKLHMFKNFKLPFFEIGTKQRFQEYKRKGGQPLKKKRALGRIRPVRFLTRAKSAKEREVFDSMETLIQDSIRRVNRRHSNDRN